MHYICNHGPHLRGRVGDIRAKVRVNYFLLYCPLPAVQGKWGFDIKIFNPGIFSIVKGRAKSMVLISSLTHGMGSTVGY